MKITLSNDFEVANAQEEKQLREAMQQFASYGTRGIINLGKELNGNPIAKAMVNRIVGKR